MDVAPEQGDIKIKAARWLVPSAHAGGIFIGADVQLKILSEKFYACSAVPFRHHIKHHSMHSIQSGKQALIIQNPS